MVQINGKGRDRVEVSVGISERDAKKAVLERGRIKAFLAGREPKKIIFVPGRLINIVV